MNKKTAYHGYPMPPETAPQHPYPPNGYLPAPYPAYPQGNNNGIPFDHQAFQAFLEQQQQKQIEQSSRDYFNAHRQEMAPDSWFNPTNVALAGGGAAAANAALPNKLFKTMGENSFANQFNREIGNIPGATAKPVKPINARTFRGMRGRAGLGFALGTALLGAASHLQNRQPAVKTNEYKIDIVKVAEELYKVPAEGVKKKRQ